MANYYLLIKSLHLIFAIFWMVGLFYLPRLFVYHSTILYNSSSCKIFQVMEYRLIKFIMNPSMILTYILGISLIHFIGYNLGIWFYIKITCVLILTLFHIFLGICRKNFQYGKNKYNSLIYRLLNEITTIMLIIIVIMVIVRPF